MPNDPATSFKHYPAYCFSLSPTHDTWARLTAADIQALEERPGFEGQSLYFHLNHPIKWVRVVGLVVAFDSLPGFYILTIDDSSGANIELKYLREKSLSTRTKEISEAKDDSGIMSHPSLAEQAPDTSGVTATGRRITLDDVDIGTIVKAKGGVTQYRGQKQINLERIAIVRSTSEEIAAWDENTAFRRDVLDRPWLVSEAEEKEARQKAEGLEQKRRHEEERARQRTARNGAKSSKAQREKLRKERQKARALKQEMERKKMEEEEKKRAEEKRREEEARRIRQRNERRENALRELGAGR